MTTLDNTTYSTPRVSAAPNGTHEQYLHGMREAIIARATERGLIDDTQAAQLAHAKLVYGVGNGTYRGVCHYSAWANGVGSVDVVEIAATAEESWVQLAGTTIHELGHVIAGWGAGHGKDWKHAAQLLGLRKPEAAGQTYVLAGIDPQLRWQAALLADQLGDGNPAFRTSGPRLRIATMPRPCSAGVGTRGGKSRGKGSGSRLRLYECSCSPVQKVRAATDELDATCNRCSTAFVLQTGGAR
jgi:hypothetical protein